MTAASESPSNPHLSFAACSEDVLRLHGALRDLERQCGLLQLPPLAGREWYELLTRKLVPQLGADPYIVAAVVGGTNIGKSVIFNHLAGERASAVSPLASGTKHPVCLVPPGFETRHDLQTIFQGFELCEWSAPEAALESGDEHRLFWKTSDKLPPNLLVLDTPDIDSDAKVNWERADRVRHCADVLIAVLTQQKYNDAAVKQFFRKAAAEDKAVIVVFNQCLLPEDEPFWPLWLDTFSRETGISPDLLYVAPNDRRAAEENRLPFFPRTWPAESPHPSAEPRSLRADLAEQQFSAIKLRTLRGGLAHVMSPEIGAPAWLDEIRRTASRFDEANHDFSMKKIAQIDNWPPPPTNLLVAEIREWWRTHRQGMTRVVHDVYGKLGDGLIWPFRWARDRISGQPPDPLDAYKSLERNTMMQAIGTYYENLARLARHSNELLRPRIERLIGGATLESLLDRLKQQHAAVDFDAEFRTVVNAQMQAFRDDSPTTFNLLKKVDAATAIARPVTSVVLFVAAAGPVGHAATAMVTDAATQSVAVHIIGDIAGGTGAVVVGETALGGAAGGMRYLEARFRQLQTAFITKRVAWFSTFLRDSGLGTI
jgi:hypothetical protein